MDEERLAGLEAAALEHIGPDREEGLGDAAASITERPCGIGKALSSAATQYSA